MRCPNCGAPLIQTKIRKPLGNKNTWRCSAGCGYGKAQIGGGRKKRKKQEKKRK